MFTLFKILKSIRTYILWFITCVIFTIICAILALLPAKIRYKNRVYFFLCKIWSKLLVFFSFLSIKIEGEEKLPVYPDSPAIIVMNHSSALDIFIIESVLESYPRVWLSKDSYGKIPLFNILMKRMHILIKRDKPFEAVKALRFAYDLVKNRPAHLLIFPEGRRYSDGEVHEFTRGFATLARKLSRPVIPVAIYGAYKIFPKNSFIIDYDITEVKIIIGDKIFVQEGETEEDFANRVQYWFEEKLKK